MQIYTSLTVGYSDSEDRLWLRLVREGGEAKLWMTRRLAMAMLDQSYGLMIGKSDESEVDREHADAVSDFLRHQGDQAPPRMPDLRVDIQSGVVTSVNVTASDDGVSWTFLSAQGQACFRGSRSEAHRLLEVFWRRMQAAGWRDLPPWTAALLGDQQGGATPL